MLQPGETSAATAIVPEALGPQSLALKHAGDNLQLLMAGTTLILQVAPPAAKAQKNPLSNRSEQHGRIDLAA